MGCAPSSPRGSRLRRSERDHPFSCRTINLCSLSRMNPREANVSTFAFLLHVHAPRVSSSHAHGTASATGARFFLSPCPCPRMERIT